MWVKGTRGHERRRRRGRSRSWSGVWGGGPPQPHSTGRLPRGPCSLAARPLPRSVPPRPRAVWTPLYFAFFCQILSIEPNHYAQLTVNKEGKKIQQWSQDSLFNEWCEGNWTDTCKKKKNETTNLHHTQK